jgi:hypothetical protein
LIKLDRPKCRRLNILCFFQTFNQRIFGFGRQGCPVSHTFPPGFDRRAEVIDSVFWKYIPEKFAFKEK